MAIVIIHLLEIIHVEIRQAQRMPVAARPIRFGQGYFIKCPAVGQAGERITARQFLFGSQGCSELLLTGAHGLLCPHQLGDVQRVGGERGL